MTDSDLHAKMPANVITKNVTMHVEVIGVRALRVRIWLAAKLIRLAARIAGVGIEFKGIDTDA